MLSSTTIAVKPIRALKASMARPKKAAGSRTASRAPRASRRLEIGGLHGHLGYFARRLQLWIFKDFIRALAALKVKPAQYSVLLLIEANAGASQSAIAQTLSIERARLARMLHALEDRGWVARVAVDGRTNGLQLTARGRQMLARVKHAALRHEDNLARRLGAKRRAQLLALLKDFG
jgi:DNA-binding MarR family transcriptional regulator